MGVGVHRDRNRKKGTLRNTWGLIYCGKRDSKSLDQARGGERNGTWWGK